MEHLGQSKTLLSERIAQQKLAEQAEAERWTKELKDIVRSDLRELVKGELDTNCQRYEGRDRTAEIGHEAVQEGGPVAEAIFRHLVESVSDRRAPVIGAGPGSWGC